MIKRSDMGVKRTEVREEGIVTGYETIVGLMLRQKHFLSRAEHDEMGNEVYPLIEERMKDALLRYVYGAILDDLVKLKAFVMMSVDTPAWQVLDGMFQQLFAVVEFQTEEEPNKECSSCGSDLMPYEVGMCDTCIKEL